MKVHADDLIMFLQLAGEEEGQLENKYEMSLMTATQGNVSSRKAAEKTQTQLSKVRREVERDTHTHIYLSPVPPYLPHR